ncbi:MAG: glycosyltransferase family 4 protein [Acidobacteriota bacterium]
MRPRTVLFLEQQGEWGGAQRILADVLALSREAGFRCAVAVQGSGPFREALRRAGYPAIDLPLGTYPGGHKSLRDELRFLLRSAWSTLVLVLLIVRHRADLLYANGPRTLPCGIAAGRLTGRPVIWHLHNVLPDGKERRLAAMLTRWVDHVIACSRSAAARLVVDRPALQAKCSVIYAPLPKWESSEPPAAADDRNLVPQRPLTFGILGRVTPFKGQEEFVEAAIGVLQQTDQARFLVVGNPAHGDRSDRDYLCRIAKRVRDLGFTEQITFLEFQPDVETCYSLIDVVVCASQGSEGLPCVLIEAMVLGKAVIGPALGGVAELVDHLRTGILVERASPRNLCEAMMALRRNPELRRSLGRSARLEVLSRFSRTRFQQEIAGILGSFLAAEQSGSRRQLA